jgi:hypothetical protein
MVVLMAVPMVGWRVDLKVVVMVDYWAGNLVEMMAV